MEVDKDAILKRMADWMETDEDVHSVLFVPGNPGCGASLSVELKDGKHMFIDYTD